MVRIESTVMMPASYLGRGDLLSGLNLVPFLLKSRYELLSKLAENSLLIICFYLETNFSQKKKKKGITF